MAPTQGAKMVIQTVDRLLVKRAGPKARAGFSAPPVKGPGGEDSSSQGKTNDQTRQESHARVIGDQQEGDNEEERQDSLEDERLRHLGEREGADSRAQTRSRREEVKQKTSSSNSTDKLGNHVSNAQAPTHSASSGKAQRDSRIEMSTQY